MNAAAAAPASALGDTPPKTCGAVRRSQTGGVYGVPLPLSGMTLWIPRFVLDPPLGASKGALLNAQAPWDRRSAPVCRAL